MTSALYKWRLFCITENTWVYNWSDSNSVPPTVCITDSSHTVNENSPSIIDTLVKNTVKIEEETTKTQGNFRSECIKINIPANTQEVLTEKTFEYPINLLGVFYHVTESNVSDTINAYAQPVYQGTILEDTQLSQNTLVVDHVTYAILNIGYLVTLKTDNYTQNLGEVLEKNNGTIVVSNNIENPFTTSDTILNIQVNGIKNLNLCNVGRHQSGGSKLGSTYINKGTKIILKYSSNENVDIDRHFHYELEYLY